MPLLTEHPRVFPRDAHNQTLVSNVHPPDWVNPDPAPRYNLVVIGGGTAVGAEALAEKHLPGGEVAHVG